MVVSAVSHSCYVLVVNFVDVNIVLLQCLMSLHNAL